ncbi:hypothetical protein [Nocardia sp. NPDC019395]|uniref:hypothetical protein n=1 Tax=Nocardia sp. NPDC019395 TaxID=3154686 RepID=UPI0033CB2EDE
MPPAEVTVSHPIVDVVLDHYRPALGSQEVLYRNHVYRCLNYQRMLFGEIPDTAALAWAVHDLGIWTEETVDYLEPSAALAEQWCDCLDIDDAEVVATLVLDHHRIRPVRDELVETFRQADRIDVSCGRIRGGLSAAAVSRVVAEFPYAGFHRFLAGRIGPYALSHPRRPLPMLRW